MAYRVDITERAERDLGRPYFAIEADSSEQARIWFNALERTVLSLDENPARGAPIPEGDGLRHLLFGRKGHRYRVIYAIDEAGGTVTVLHVRHGARDAFRPDEPAMATLKNKRSSREVKARPSFLKKRSKKLLFLEAVAGHRSATATQKFFGSHPTDANFFQKTKAEHFPFTGE